MKVKFSRHAKRRAKLYEIPESTIEKILAASKKINIDTILSYTLELDQGILRKKIA